MAHRLARRFSRFPRVRYRTRVLVKRGASAAARAAMSERHTLAAVGTALAFGYFQSKIDIPAIAGLTKSATLGLGLWAAGRYTKNRTLQHMATGMLCVAAAGMGASMATGTGVSGEESLDF